MNHAFHLLGLFHPRILPSAPVEEQHQLYVTGKDLHQDLASVHKGKEVPHRGVNRRKKALMSLSLGNQSFGKKAGGFQGELEEQGHGAGGGRGKQEGIPGPQGEV